MHRAAPIVLLAALGTPLLGQDSVPATPLVAPAQAQQAAQPEPKAPVYDEAADGAAQIAAALEAAKGENRRVLVQWGANWCGWCNLLHDHMKADRALAQKLQYEYDVVHIDIGKWDKHLELADKLGADFQSHGVPFLTVLDAEGNVLANQETGSLEAPDDPDHSHDSAKLMSFLTEHQAPPQNAADVMDDALSQARTQGKLAFVHFGAPWCGWCHRLEAFLAREDVWAILGEHVVDVKIDTDRMIGGGAMLVEMRGSQRGGIPWFAFLDGDGEIVAHSSQTGENLGCPYTDEEIAAFMALLERACPDITAEQRALLASRLGPQKEAPQKEAPQKEAEER